MYDLTTLQLINVTAADLATIDKPVRHGINPAEIEYTADLIVASATMVDADPLALLDHASRKPKHAILEADLQRKSDQVV